MRIRAWLLQRLLFDGLLRSRFGLLSSLLGSFRSPLTVIGEDAASDERGGHCASPDHTGGCSHDRDPCLRYTRLSRALPRSQSRRSRSM